MFSSETMDGNFARSGLKRSYESAMSDGTESAAPTVKIPSVQNNVGEHCPEEQMNVVDSGALNLSSRQF